MAAAGALPVVLFTAGGIATPADAAMMMQLGADGVFVGSGIFKSGDPAARAAAIVKATTFHDDPDVIAKVSRRAWRAHGGDQPGHAPARAALRRPRLVTAAAGAPRAGLASAPATGDRLAGTSRPPPLPPSLAASAASASTRR